MDSSEGCVQGLGCRVYSVDFTPRPLLLLPPRVERGIYIYTHTYIYIYIYTHTKREKERETETERQKEKTEREGTRKRGVGRAPLSPRASRGLRPRPGVSPPTRAAPWQLRPPRACCRG